MRNFLACESSLESEILGIYTESDLTIILEKGMANVKE